VSARSKARKRALDLVFEADARGVSATSLLAERRAAGAAQAAGTPSGGNLAAPVITEYTVTLVEGVSANLERIDELLATYAQGWSVERMPAVDRAILRVAAWELLYNDGVPDAVAIDEAVELARLLSTDSSPAFVNGLLARLLDVKPGLMHS
jgi:N utilization substance protein B